MAKWITKASDEVLSHCKCEHALAALPSQLDCPWCGCGYLISCTYCRKAFTFGRVVETDRSYTDLTRLDRERGGWREDERTIVQYATMIEDLLSPFAVGDELVYFDGVFLGTDDRTERFDGLFAHHNFDVLPHAACRTGKRDIVAALGEPAYWFDREHSIRD